jgi:hypothetical protein
MATYFVKNLGNDSNTGLSDGQAWRTISHVNSVSFIPGDSILFNRGDTWRESLTVQSGSGGGYITYGDYGTGNKPLILGSVDATNGWINVGTNIWQNSNSSFTAQVGNLIFNYEESTGIKVQNEVDLNVQGEFWYDYTNDRIRMYSVGSPTVYYTHIEAALWGGTWGWFIPLISKNYVILENLDCRYSGNAMIVGTSSSNIIIRGCKTAFNGGCYEGGDWPVSPVRLGGAIGTWNSNNNWLVERCIAENEYDGGLTIQGDGSSHNVHDITFRYNIVSKCEFGFEFFWTGSDYSTTISNIYIQNNAFVSSGTGWAHNQRTGSSPMGEGFECANIMATLSNFYVRNNLFKDATERLVWIKDTTKAANITWDYNCYYQTLGGYWGTLDYVNNYSSFATYRTALGKEVNGTGGNPLLTSTTDFHLTTGSSCINTGVDVGYTSDFDGVLLVGLPDIGAYEYEIPPPTTEFYIDPGGSNSNTGSAASPWLTLYYACSMVSVPGSTIHVNAGDYYETQRATCAVGVSILGVNSYPLTSIIHTTYVASSLEDGAIYLNSPGYANGNQSISYIKFDGEYVSQDVCTATRGIYIGYRHNVVIHHCEVNNFQWHGIYFRGGSGEWMIPPTTYATGNSVYNVVINNCSTRNPSQQGDCLKINSQSGFRVYNCHITQNTRSSGNNGECIGGEWNKGLKIYDSVFRKPDIESNWNFFFELHWFIGGGEIYRNNFNGNAVVDIVTVMKDEPTYDYGVKIYENLFLVDAITNTSSHDSMAIDIEQNGSSEGIHIYRNYIRNHGDGIWMVTGNWSYTGITYMRDFYIYDNIIENVGYLNDPYSYGIAFIQDKDNNNTIVDNFNVYNNTIISSTGSTRAYIGIIGPSEGTITNVRIKNNIIQGFSNYAVSFRASGYAGTITGCNVDNNLYYQNGYNNVEYVGTTVTGNTQNNIIVQDPQFMSIVDPKDFHLQATSPAIGAGTRSGLTLTVDYEGSLWGTIPDIGALAYEGIPEIADYVVIPANIKYSVV